MSRNTDRLGLDNKQVSQSSPSITQMMLPPTVVELIDLPSKGKFYPQGHPLHNVEHVEVRQMTTIDEEILGNKTFIKNGIMFDKLIESVLINKNINPKTLLVGDKNAILFGLRKINYGNEYKAAITCNICSYQFQKVFDLNEVVPKDFKDEDEHLINADGTFNITIHNNINVQVRLLTGQDEEYLIQVSKNKEKRNLPETPVQDLLNQVIVSVNGNEDRSFINDFIKTLVMSSSRKLREEYARIAPNLDIEREVRCEMCGSDLKISIPFNPSFFWPDR